MSDSFTEVTSESWFGRIKNSFGGALVGIVLFFAAFYILWTNEGCAVANMEALSEIGNKVTHVEGKPKPANNGKLIHFTGKTQLSKTLKDPQFGITVPALRLRRDVEMYQWVQHSSSEKEKNLGGSEETTTTYTYEKEWSSTLQDSSNFKKPAGHKNPKSMKWKSETWNASDVTVNGFKVAAQFIDGVGSFGELSGNPSDIKSGNDGGKKKKKKKGAAKKKKSNVKIVKKPKKKGYKKSGEWYYKGKGNPNNPKVGDYRIRWTMVPAGPVSLIGKQQGTKLVGYTTDNGQTKYMAATGMKSPEAMVASAKDAEGTRTWLMRLAGFACMFFGLTMVFAPLGTILDVVPLFGGIMRFGAGIFSFVVAAAFSLVTIAVAWIAYRPFLAIGLLVVGGGLLFYFWYKGKDK